MGEDVPLPLRSRPRPDRFRSGGPFRRVAGILRMHVRRRLKSRPRRSHPVLHSGCRRFPSAGLIYVQKSYAKTFHIFCNFFHVIVDILLVPDRLVPDLDPASDADQYNVFFQLREFS